MVEAHSVQLDVFSVEPETAVSFEFYRPESHLAEPAVRNGSAVVKLCFEGVKVRRIGVPETRVFSGCGYFLIGLAFGGQQYVSVFIGNNVLNRISSDAFCG